MATTPLIVGGNFKIGATDFSDAVTKVRIFGDADEVDIPPTLAGPKSTRKGGVQYSVELDYLSNDTDATAELFRVLWTALSSGNGQLAASTQMRDGAISATNPEWQFTMVVTHASLGGEAEGLSSDSVTFKLTGAPVIDTTP